MDCKTHLLGETLHRFDVCFDTILPIFLAYSDSSQSALKNIELLLIDVGMVLATCVYLYYLRGIHLLYE